ncbi:hypothetical protein SI65_03710 [Aspergillus cristatus]|uniref:Helicase C-terminal domain-containing protein n=1 Tax=Aspergillus cristatus TaxID=573508 RepID=A0A1E3BIB7_ASPCR|nr:hypothetical protein SI65_03710 [Aspergillus cristatus]
MPPQQRKRKPTTTPRSRRSTRRKPSKQTSTTTSPSPPSTTTATTLEIPVPSPPDPTAHGLPRDIPEVVRSLPYAGKKSPRTLLARGLPPMHQLGNIYQDMTRRAMELGFGDVVEHLGDRALRVVTVCSGTESPLLALEMVQRNLREDFGRCFDFKHLFSAEIVPFKQAYIERNFHPRYLFRDVAELKDRVAQTAYGSLEKIPKNPDILIAGFSCVDFSGLNNNRKTLDEKGESGGTFWGIVRYAITYRPRIVILENVKNAPWDEIKENWNEIGYFAVHMTVDTKAYYLPQTRERGYMFCIDRSLLEEREISETDMEQWLALFTGFKRPASSPAGMFLMDSDDRRLEQIEKDMAAYITSSSAKTTVNWARYQIRHQGYRLEQNLGHRRPISRSQEDGTCQMPDFAWQTYVRSLPERVWDTIDANFLRKLGENGYDMNYKERCIDLSQGLDRETDTRAYGLVGCITPCGIPYITTRGGPLCGLEALALQGLPLDRLLLTRERHRELQDLAGNAMSSTVVGAAVLSALIVGHKVLNPGDKSAPKNAESKRKQINPRDDYPLVSSGVPLGHVFSIDTAYLQMQAARSARYCTCERQTATQQNILRCTLCDHTACSDCAGNPTHAYERWSSLTRSQPLDFVSHVKNILPTRLVLSGISPEDYDSLSTTSLGCPPAVWNNFLEAVSRAIGDELRFLDIKRCEDWTVSYQGRYSILNLVISPTSIHWLFFAKPSELEPALCLNREILSKPIARMTPVCGSLLDGKWEVCAPISSRCTMAFSGTGERVMSYEARCGLQMKQFIGSEVWSQITVQAADEDVRDLEIDIRGTYELLPECGTANASLHKKAATAGTPAVYLFLDPHKINEAENDSFVFSLEHRRIPGYAPRLTVAEVSHTWRPSRATTEPEHVNMYYRKWTKAQTAHLTPYDSDAPITCAKLQPGTEISIGRSECRDANVTLLSFSAPASLIDSLTPKGSWEIINPIESSDMLKDLSWLVQRVAGFSDFQQWTEVTNRNNPIPSNEDPICTVCIPPKPRTLWGRNRKGWIKAYEDPYDAALYERQVKAKPPPFLVFRRVDEDDLGHLRVTLNIQTLLHQACDKLVGSKIDNEVAFFWRLVPNAYGARNLAFPKFQLSSNKHDPQSMQPPGFRLSLRPEQLRSLSWMIGQEDDDVAPFEEEETEEAFLPFMMWRAEARATTQKVVRGGVLADDVGYGKTAIILGLIDIQAQRARHTVQAPIEGLIPSNATLIVIPHIMLPQWKSEIEKFLGNRYKVLVFQSAASFTSKTIRDVRSADIILVSWSVFNNGGYYEKMHKFTGMPRVPMKAGRNFDHWFEDAQVSLRSHVQILMDQGPNALLKAIRAKRQEVKDKQENSTYVPSRRLRGKVYTEANIEKLDTDSKMHYADVSSAEEESDASDSEYPDRLRANVDRHLKLRATGSLCAHPTDGLDDSDSEGQETEYEDSSTDDPVDARNCCRKGRGRKRKYELGSASSGKGRWNDRKEFNITEDDSQDWATVKTPLLHAFSFNRLVIDEFTYANPERLAPLLSFEAHSKWILSGTPPLNDFADVNTIAPFLGIHLGVDDDDDDQSQNKRLKTIWKHRSEAEAFQSFKAPYSKAWHRRRHEVAQSFLNRFARKNVAEIDEIPYTEHIVLIDQSPAERAIYLELYKQLMAQNRQLRRRNQGQFGNDQIERLDEIISNSSSPEEALLKRCSSLALQGRWDYGKPEAVTCETLLAIREKQLDALVHDIRMKFKLAAWVYCSCDLKYESFQKFVESLIRHDFGDSEVTEKAYPLLKGAVFMSRHDDWKMFFAELRDDGSSEKVVESQNQSESDASDGDTENKDDENFLPSGSLKKRKTNATGNGVKSSSNQKTGRKKTTNSKADKIEQSVLPPKPRKTYEYEVTLREVTSTLRNLIVEWVLRERALRFLRTVRLIQTGTEVPVCDGCDNYPNTLDDGNVLGSCGHAVCAECARDTVLREECAVDGCRGSGKRFNIIKASTLGYDHEDKSATFGGSKLDKLVEIIRGIPKDERALLFIQFPELMEVASKALELAQIKHTVISPTDRRSAQKVEQFQKTSFGDNRVLILNLGGEMAAGLNLQCANHVIFLSPLLGQTQYDYDSSMTQAIGRCRRYGQTGHVHVYHLLAKLTIDVNIFQERRERVLVEKDGRPVLVSHEEAVESEAISCEGPSLVMDNAF